MSMLQCYRYRYRHHQPWHHQLSIDLQHSTASCCGTIISAALVVLPNIRAQGSQAGEGMMIAIAMLMAAPVMHSRICCWKGNEDIMICIYSSAIGRVKTILAMPFSIVIYY